MQFKLDLREVAVGYFAISDESSDLERAIAGEAMGFAAEAIAEYQRLERKAIETLTQQTGDEGNALIDVLDDPQEESEGPSEITATELVKVLELQRSLRGDNSAAADILTMLGYLWARSSQDVDWQMILHELGEIVAEDEGPKA